MSDLIRLKVFPSDGEMLLLDPASGKTQPPPPAERGSPCRGYATSRGSEFVAIYAEGERLYLWHQGRQFELAVGDGTPLAWERVGDGRLNRATLRTLFGSPHAVVYESCGYQGRADPTYDAMDEEMEDLFLFLSRVTKTRAELMAELVRAR